ncbi:MAG: hypothetical protein LBQ02_02920 [Candidatus Nomurabacteria bacterium]|jgi:hypothetical protein|nr:hypothetical protein [Candidatus Nomurabacteria bacterium]
MEKSKNIAEEFTKKKLYLCGSWKALWGEFQKFLVVETGQRDVREIFPAYLANAAPKGTEALLQAIEKVCAPKRCGRPSGGAWLRPSKAAPYLSYLLAFAEVAEAFPRTLAAREEKRKSLAREEVADEREIRALHQMTKKDLQREEWLFE